MNEKDLKRTRIEEGYRATISKDGRLSTNLDVETSNRVRRYCEQQNINKTKFVCACVNKQLDVYERDLLQAMDKDQLIKLLLEKRQSRGQS